MGVNDTVELLAQNAEPHEGNAGAWGGEQSS